VTVLHLQPVVTRPASLWADPLLTKNPLLLALAWHHLIETQSPRIASEDVCGLTGWSDASYRGLCLEDVPVYEAPSRPRACPNVGPRGGKCQRSPAGWRALRDPDDGAITWVTACRAHWSYVQYEVAAHAEFLGARVPPKPAYNTRSRLARHFPEIDFPVWWSKLTQGRREPYDVTRDPDRGGSPLIQRPNLRVVLA
jgi:hypothetical protein